MLCRLHTVYKIIHCVALHTLCNITQSVSNHTVKWSIFCVTPGKIYTCQKKLHGHRLWRPWQISGMVCLYLWHHKKIGIIIEICVNMFCEISYFSLNKLQVNFMKKTCFLETKNCFLETKACFLEPKTCYGEASSLWEALALFMGGTSLWEALALFTC